MQENEALQNVLDRIYAEQYKSNTNKIDRHHYHELLAELIKADHVYVVAVTNHGEDPAKRARVLMIHYSGMPLTYPFAIILPSKETADNPEVIAEVNKHIDVDNQTIFTVSEPPVPLIHALLACNSEAGISINIGRNGILIPYQYLKSMIEQ